MYSYSAQVIVEYDDGTREQLSTLVNAYDYEGAFYRAWSADANRDRRIVEIVTLSVFDTTGADGITIFPGTPRPEEEWD